MAENLAEAQDGCDYAPKPQRAPKSLDKLAKQEDRAVKKPDKEAKARGQSHVQSHTHSVKVSATVTPQSSSSTSSIVEPIQLPASFKDPFKYHKV